MAKYSLGLEGAAKRRWDVAVAGRSLSTTAGTATSPGRPAKQTHPTAAAATHALYAAMLTKLRAGYALAEPSGAMIGALGLAPRTGPVALSPDATEVWSVHRDAHGKSIVQIHALASATLRAAHALPARLGRVADLRVHGASRALLATARGVVELGEDGAATPWSRENKSPSTIEVAGDRVIVTGKGEAVLFDTGARTIARIAKVAIAALSADGAMLVVADAEAAVLRVIETRKGKELTQLSLGTGRGVRALAIAQELVVATGIWFEGAKRRSTWCWSLPSGERTKLDAFPDEHDEDHAAVALGPGGALIALAAIGGSLVVASDEPFLFDSLMFCCRGRGLTLCTVGHRLLGYASSGAVAVWGFERIAAGEGSNDALEVAATDAVADMMRERRATKGREARKTPRPAEPRGRASPRPFRDGIELLTIPLGHMPRRSDGVRDGVVYTTRHEHSTFVDLSAWPPTWMCRPQVVRHHARCADGRWLIRDRDWLWLTDTFGEQGRELTIPLELWALGWLGDAPIVFDEAGAVPPQVHTDDGWKPITGLAKVDAPGGTGVIPFDGAPIVTFRGGGYRVNTALRARRVIDANEVQLHFSTALPDGRCVANLGRTLRVFRPDLSYVDVPVGGNARRHRCSHVAPGLDGRLLVTYAAPRGANLTPEAGALIDPADGRPQLLAKAQFGLSDAKQIEELLPCGDRILARLGGSGMFRAIPWPAAPPRRRS